MDLKQLAAQGKLTSEVVIRALRKLGASGAEDLKKILENDPTQVFKNLQNEVENLQIAVGSALLPAAKALTEVLTITAQVLVLTTRVCFCCCWYYCCDCWCNLVNANIKVNVCYCCCFN